jgi:hypothetical protein
MTVLLISGCAAYSQANPSGTTNCGTQRRAEVLRSLQRQVLQSVPHQLDSLEDATKRGGRLEGWRLSHGHVVLAGAGAVAVDNTHMRPPMPQLLLYAPAPSSSPADWIDFDGPDGPYQLVGWAFLAPYKVGSTPPELPCLRVDDWFVHEAGWHLTNGTMLLTPGAETEPPRPPIKTGVHFWHPSGWDIHFWIGNDVPTIAFDNPRARDGGLCLPDGSFYSIVNGRKQPVRTRDRCTPPNGSSTHDHAR